MKILPKGKPRHIGELARAERGEPGTRHQASPDPHTTTYLNQKSRVVT